MSFNIDSHQAVLNCGGVDPTIKFQKINTDIEEINKTIISIKVDTQNFRNEREKELQIFARKLNIADGFPQIEDAELSELLQNPITSSDISLDVKPSEVVDQNIGLNQGAKKNPKWIDSISKILLISYLFFSNTIYNIIRYVALTSAYKAKSSLDKFNCHVSDKNCEIPGPSI